MRRSGCQRMRQAQEIAMRPSAAPLVFQHLMRKLGGRFREIPIGYRGPQTTSPTAQVFHQRGEGAKVRTGARLSRQRFQSRRIGVRIREFRAGCQCEHKQRRIVFRSASRDRDFLDDSDNAQSVRLQALANSNGILEDQLTLRNVVRSSLASEDQKTLQAHPVVDWPHVSTGGVRYLLRAICKGLHLWRPSRVEYGL